MKKINAPERATLLHQLHARLAVERARPARRRLNAVVMAVCGVPFEVISEVMKADERAVRTWLSRALDDGIGQVGSPRLDARSERARTPAVKKLRAAISEMLTEKLSLRERRRLHAVDAVLAGSSIAAAARDFRMSPTAVGEALRLLRTGGPSAMRYKRLGRKPRGKPS